MKLSGKVFASIVVGASVCLAACGGAEKSTLLTAAELDGEVSIFELKKLPGTTVADAVSARPETPMSITGYRVEKVALPRSVKARVWGGQLVDVRTVWRITMRFDKRLIVRDAALSLVIDGQFCGGLQEAPDVLSAGTICFDSSLVRDGASLGVTYGLPGGADTYYSSVKLRLSRRGH